MGINPNSPRSNLIIRWSLLAGALATLSFLLWHLGQATPGPAPGTGNATAPATIPAPTNDQSRATTRGVGGTGATRPGSADAPLLPRNDIPGLPNFAQVAPGLYRGAQPTAEGFRQLQAMGVKTVVNLRWLHSDRDKLKGTGLGYVNIQCKAWHPEEQDTVQILKVITDPANQPVFIHCQQGADRTGCAIAVYRMVEEGWTPDEAMAEMPRFNFHPVWTEIIDYLKRFDVEATRKKVKEAAAPEIETVR